MDITQTSWKAWLWWMFPLSVVFHLVFKQDTPFMEMMSQPLGLLITGVALAFMSYMGARNCHRIKR